MIYLPPFAPASKRQGIFCLSELDTAFIGSRGKLPTPDAVLPAHQVPLLVRCYTFTVSGQYPERRKPVIIPVWQPTKSELVINPKNRERARCADF